MRGWSSRARRARASMAIVAQQTQLSSTYGTASEVASASRALAAAPAVWPIDQPRFDSANASPCAMPSASAPSDSSAIDGAHSIPIAGAARITSAISCQAASGHGNSSISDRADAEADQRRVEPAAAVRDRARRSGSRPTPAAPRRARWRRSRPRRRRARRAAAGRARRSCRTAGPGTAISQIPPATRPSRSAATQLARGRRALGRRGRRAQRPDRRAACRRRRRR